jgi:hypothetical protein
MLESEAGKVVPYIIIRGRIIGPISHDCQQLCTFDCPTFAADVLACDNFPYRTPGYNNDSVRPRNDSKVVCVDRVIFPGVFPILLPW